MAFKLSAKSEARLVGVHPDLVRVVRRAIATTPIDFMVNEGKRTVAQQKKNIAKGVSQTMDSRHIPGKNKRAMAVDLVPIVGGKSQFVSWAPYYPLAKAVKAAAQAEKVPIVWGGDWKSFKDGPHFELDRKKYPA